MNKRTFWILALLIVISVTSAYAKEDGESAKTASQGESQKKQAERLKKIEEKKKDLNGSQWDVVVKSQGKGEKDAEDALTFQNGQVSSKNLAKRGFNPTNYTITVPESPDQPAVWETMQTGKEGVIFIRGEWMKDAMQGSISEQLDGGKQVKDYYFTTAKRTAISPTSSEEETVESVAKSAGSEKPNKVLTSLESKPKNTTASSKK